MKTTSLARRNALLSPARVSAGAAALILAALALMLRFAAPDAFFRAAAPVFRAGDAVTEFARASTAGLRSAAALAAREDDLAAQNAALAAENRALAAELADLTGLFSGAPESEPGILAGVLARPPVIAYDTLLLGAGSTDGVSAGMEAFGPGGVPLGVVASVTAHFSQATLFSAPGMTVDGWAGEARVPVTLSGAGAGAFSASVPRATGLKAGDAVFVPGPGALPVGIISRIDGDPSAPLVALRITPAINPFSVTWVLLREAAAPLAATTTP